MGNFSRVPKDRLDHSISEQYVGVRMQQGVPLLDADWNLMEDLRRAELEHIAAKFIGDGVPQGSDGFNILPARVGNDFVIRAGLCVVGGKLTRNNVDVLYSRQPNFNNPGVIPPLPPLTNPGEEKSFIVYLDVFEREVDSQNDPDLKDPRIGVETAIAVKRDWVVRVDIEGSPALGNPGPGHVFLPLARLRRENSDEIRANMIDDLREIQLSLQRRIEVRNAANQVVLDTTRFGRVLEETRRSALAFERFMLGKFTSSAPTQEVVAILDPESNARTIVQTALAGVSHVLGGSLSNRAALRLLAQLYQAEQSFRITWEALIKTGGFATLRLETFIRLLSKYLNEEKFGRFIGLGKALETNNLAGAADTQEEISRLFTAARAPIFTEPADFGLSLETSGGERLTPGRTATLKFLKLGNFNADEIYDVSILPASGWPRRVMDPHDPTPLPSPVRLRGNLVLPVEVDVESGSSMLQLRLVSLSNPFELDLLSGLFTLTEGGQTPLAQNTFGLHIRNTNQASLGADGIMSFAFEPETAGEVKVLAHTFLSDEVNIDFTVEFASKKGDWNVRLKTSRLELKHAQPQELTIEVTPGANADTAQIRLKGTTSLSSGIARNETIIPCRAE
jgi:hypothetical protein